MKVFNNNKNTELLPQLQEKLNQVRSKKLFNKEEYIKYKSFALNQYLKTSKIDAVVIGISGGIDSAVSLGLLVSAMNADNVIKKIYAVSIPALKSDGAVSNQLEATSRGELVIKHFGQKPYVIDLSETLQSAKEATKSLGLDDSLWSNGQLVPNLRTSISYYLTSLISENNGRGVVIGTINRDEGSYLGYMGKAGDSLVDIQLISDLHKSEVYQLAQHFNIPRSIIDNKPNGDMFDNRTDEEVFGASYDFVELYLNFLRLNKTEQSELLTQLSTASQSQFAELSLGLEKLHSHNRHKYLTSSSAVHLDLFDTYIEGGWKNNSTYIKDPPLNPNMLVNLNQIDESIFSRFKKGNKTLSDLEVDLLLGQISSWVPAGIDGYSQMKDSTIGSFRATIYSQKLADIIKDRISAQPFALDEGSLYRFSGVSPSFRFIRYESGGQLIPHYDRSFVYHEKKKTLFTLIIYLSIPDSGGKTRFIKETRKNHQFKDWIDGSSFEVVSIPLQEKGHHLIFPHQTLHDGEKIDNGQKIIIRTDLVYEKIG